MTSNWAYGFIDIVCVCTADFEIDARDSAGIASGKKGRHFLG
ncbi:hypothetical protein QSH57_004566 [Fusarium oxysporum f. sp. vasinfectum]|nr:hypothetical protein QSH57_004566 [Fusarium oxysporum f. sp. vasinfectum]